MDNNGYFVITSVHRDDLEAAGFDSSKVTDEQMELLAKYMANDYLNQYQDRDTFSYDFNSDALYNQYKDSYIQQGQMAMMDTMGHVATMTGGYGNSYAQTVGQQAYNQQLSQLNDIMPELYGMAYDRYQKEGQEMLQMYDLYMGRENDRYSKHLDSVNLWNNEFTQAWNTYDTLYDEYTAAYDKKYAEKENERKWNYQYEQDTKTEFKRLADRIAGIGYEPTDSELEAAGMTREQAKGYKKAYDDSKITTGGNNGTTYTKLTYEEQKKWEKDFGKATNASDLERIGDRMEQAGVDPAVVASWVDYYKGLLFPSSPQPGNTPKPATGGSGSGTMYWEVK